MVGKYFKEKKDLLATLGCSVVLVESKVSFVIAIQPLPTKCWFLEKKCIELGLEPWAYNIKGNPRVANYIASWFNSLAKALCVGACSVFWFWVSYKSNQDLKNTLNNIKIRLQLEKVILSQHVIII